MFTIRLALVADKKGAFCPGTRNLGMKNGWLTSSNKPVENRELWNELLSLVEKFPFISFYKVSGHVGDLMTNLLIILQIMQ